MYPLLRTAIKAFILLVTIASVQSQDEGGKYLLHYQNYPEYSVLIPAASTLNNINTLEDCAKNCNQTTAIACNSFVFCDSTKTCTLYTQHVLDMTIGTDVKVDKDPKCALYATNTYVEDFYNVSSNCIDDSEVAVTGKSLETCAQYCSLLKENCNSFNYIPELDSTVPSRCTFTKFAPSMKNYPASYDPLCYNYEKKVKNGIKNIAVTPEGHATIDQEENMKDNNTDLTKGSYLLHYKSYPGYRVLIPGASVLKDINSLEDCARNCNQTTAIACRSFVFCDSTKTCTLYIKHVLDFVAGTDAVADKTAKCALYSTNTYVEDYYDKSSKCIDDPTLTVTGKPLIYCVQACTALKKRCNSFNYFTALDPSVSRCTFTVYTTSMKNYPSIDDPFCSNYEKKFKDADIGTTVKPGDRGTTAKPGDRGTTTKPGTEDTQPGSTKGNTVAIVAGVLGLLVGLSLIGFFGYRYYRRNYGTSLQHSQI